MAQNPIEYGRIISATEGETLFGKVVSSYQLGSTELLGYIQNAGNLIMFAEENAELYVAGTGRKILSSNVQPPSPDLVFNVFNVSKVDELLALGGNTQTDVQIRTDVLDLRNGAFMLEFGTPCPPYCG